MKRLIINADDYGMSDQFNSGILELIKKGIVTSTTVMVKRKFINPQDLLKHHNISIGLHLELPLKSPEKDIKGQIGKFQKIFGKLPSHIDSHKYYHLLPGNFSQVLKIVKEYEMPIRTVSPADRRIARKARIRTADQLISWHPDRKEKMFHDLRSATGKTVELLCHPGYFDPRSSSSYNKQREREPKILKSKKFESLAKNYQRINYHDC